MYMCRKTFFENPNDPYILLRLPMTKAAVRAMVKTFLCILQVALSLIKNIFKKNKDAMTDFASKTQKVNLQKFLVAGASKRGWTTWTTAAVDKRVFAAIPIVMDMLSLNTVIKA